MNNACDTQKEECNETPKHHGGEEHCDMTEKMLCLADEAWKDLLKEKIKQEIEKSSGQRLSTIAKLVSEANHRRWTQLIQGKQQCEEFKQQLKEVFSNK